MLIKNPINVFILDNHKTLTLHCLRIPLAGTMKTLYFSFNQQCRYLLDFLNGKTALSKSSAYLGVFIHTHHHRRRKEFSVSLVLSWFINKSLA